MTHSATLDSKQYQNDKQHCLRVNKQLAALALKRLHLVLAVSGLW